MAVCKRLALLGLMAQRRFQAGKGEIIGNIRFPRQRTRQRKGLRIALLGLFFNLRPAGIAQPHQLGRLVKRLANRIIAGCTIFGVLTKAGHFKQLAMAAGDQQQ